MKKIFLVLFVLVAAGSVGAQMPTVEELEAQIQALQDSIAEIQSEEAFEVEEKEPTTPTSMKAQLFAGFDITEYRGEFGFERVQDGVTSYIRGEFRLNCDHRMTMLKVGGVEVFRDYTNPRPAVLPVNNVGEARKFYAYLSAREGVESEVAWASFYDEHLDADESINFTLRLGDQSQLLGFSSEDVEGVDLTIWSNNYQIGYYDNGLQAFWIWFDPNMGIIEYQIRHAWTGEILQVGQLSPVDNPTVTEGHVFNISLDDGIEVVDLKGYGSQYFYRGFPGQEEVDEVTIPAKVFILERDEDIGTHLYLEGFHGNFVVRVHQDQGEMDLWPIQVMGYGSYTIPAGPEKLVVIFYGDEDLDGKFFASFYDLEGGLG